MPAQWTGEIVGKLHANRIQQTKLAAHMGLTPEYVSMVLSGKRCPKDAEERFRKAVNELCELSARPS